MSPELTFYIFAFLFGSAIGSFLNVVIYRVPLGISIVHPPSKCPRCEIQLKWYWNIPIIGWLGLRGKCRNCAQPISPRYPIVELLTGVVAVAVAWTYGPTFWSLFMFAFAAALIAITYIDLDHMIIPDAISLPGIGIGLLGQLLIPGGSLKWALIAVIVGGGSLYLLAWAHYLIRRVEGLGGGDIKLLAMIGAFTSPLGVLQTVLVGSLSGTVIGVGYLLASRKGSDTRIPFGPFLALGALSYVLWPELMDALVLGELLAR